MARPKRHWHMVEASRDEASLATRLYNDPAEVRSFEGFAVHMHLVWLYLLHAGRRAPVQAGTPGAGPVHYPAVMTCQRRGERRADHQTHDPPGAHPSHTPSPRPRQTGTIAAVMDGYQAC